MDPNIDKYTDQDVIADYDRLHHLVIAYLRQYAGTFEVLTTLRDRALGGAQLPVPHVRLVLNCMRADVHVVNMPAPQRSALDATDVIREVPHTPFQLMPPSASRRTTHRVTYRPARIELPAKWHYRHGMSTRERAQVIHVLNVKRSTITYFPLRTEQPYDRRFKVDIKWLCGAYVSGWSDNYAHMRLIGAEEVQALISSKQRRPCRRCFELAQ